MQALPDMGDLRTKGANEREDLADGAPSGLPTSLSTTGMKEVICGTQRFLEEADLCPLPQEHRATVHRSSIGVGKTHSHSLQTEDTSSALRRAESFHLRTDSRESKPRSDELTGAPNP